MKPIHIFRSGTHTDSTGITTGFSEDAIKASAAAYNPTLHEAPIVVGHPKDNGPAYGWVSQLRFDEQGLEAEPHQIDADFEELVKAGRYKKISASFYTPESPNNPVPGVFYLRHVGFLGAQPPAIKGLKDIAFNEKEEGIVEFSAPYDTLTIASVFRRLREFLIDKFSREEADEVIASWAIDELELSARQEENTEASVSPAFSETNPIERTEDNGMTEEELAQKKAELEDREASLAAKETQFNERECAISASEAAIARQSISAELDTLVQKGKLLPAHKDQMVAFMASLDTEKGVVSFGEGEQKTTLDQRTYLLKFLSGLPQQVDFNEHSKDDQSEPPASSDELARKALAYQEQARKEGRMVTITEAVNTIRQQGSNA
ncbi:hypothetical protein GCM10023116_04100 [Kistimonas scapharcae]|uniref:Peptidase n=2 Tax=Kistimonas scapharcae TaxID=1036133 RepID=A0ABP8UW66_9GAMM